MAKNTQYRFVGGHPESLSDGRTLEPGELYDLDRGSLEDHDKQLFRDGKFLKYEEGTSTNVTEAAAQLAGEHNVDPADVPPTGADGQVTKEDVEKFVAAQEGEKS